MTKKEPYTDEELREIVKAIPVYPYVLDDKDVWECGGEIFSLLLCHRSNTFKEWWTATVEAYSIESFLGVKEGWRLGSGKRLRQFYLEHCREVMEHFNNG